MGASFDPSQFLRRLNFADQVVRRAALRAMRELMGHGERRAKELVPILTGTLAGTIRSDVHLQGERLEGRILAGGGEAADYAIRQHEEPMQHTHPVEGHYASKYVEQQLNELVAKAGPFLAGEIKAALG
jgi:hypothetical protein